MTNLPVLSSVTSCLPAHSLHPLFPPTHPASRGRGGKTQLCYRGQRRKPRRLLLPEVSGASLLSADPRVQGGVSESLYQIVQLWVITEEGLVLLLLLVDEVLYVHVEAGRGDALGALRGLLALLKQQSQEREQRVPAG